MIYIYSYNIFPCAACGATPGAKCAGLSHRTLVTRAGIGSAHQPRVEKAEEHSARHYFSPTKKCPACVLEREAARLFPREKIQEWIDESCEEADCETSMENVIRQALRLPGRQSKSVETMVKETMDRLGWSYVERRGREAYFVRTARLQKMLVTMRALQGFGGVG